MERRGSTPMTDKRGVFTSERKGIGEEITSLVAFRGGILPELTNGLQRVGHTIVVYRQNLYLYGGYGPKHVYSNEIFCNYKMTLHWKEIRGLGVVPTGRANHSAVMHENKMIIYGGHRNLEVFDDLYILSIDTMRWEKVNYEHAQGPGPVFSHVAVYVPPTQTMVVIGGFHQRKHNMYVAHSFDIRHRIWNGIRGPESVNPIHIQMCTAAYHSASSSIIVIGMADKEVLTVASCDTPTVYMMNVHSGLWVEVNTPVSPESPISFRLGNVWEYFLRDVVTMGGVYDDKRQEWYFPLFLSPIEKFFLRNKAERMQSISSVESKLRSLLGGSMYGFLKLQMSDMKWSIVPTKFPKRVIAEIVARRKSSRAGLVDRPNATRRPKGKKNADNNNVGRVFSAKGVSRFQRKYAFAVVDASAMRGPRNCDKLVVMHGGIDADDYIMLLFSPILKKRVMLPVADPIDAFVAFNDVGAPSFPSLSRCGGSTDYSSLVLDDSASDSESDLNRQSAEKLPEGEQDTVKDEDDVNIMVGRLHRMDSDPTLLPTLPSSRHSKNVHRFAVLYHPQNAVHKEKLLPDPTCPVAVMENDTQVRAWANNYYSETRQWIAKSLGVVREEERKTRMNRRRGRRNTRTLLNDEVDDETSSDMDSVSVESVDAKTTGIKPLPKRPPSPPPKPNDFFLDKNLEVFSLGDQTVRRAMYYRKTPFLLPGETSDSMGKLRMSVRRIQEVQRLPSAVFQRSSLGNITNVGGAMAYLLMEAALARFENGSLEARRQRALIRWRYLRVMVLIGEASFILHRAMQAEKKGAGVAVSSTSQLILAPDLQINGLGRNKVPSRAIPYTVPSLPTRNIRCLDVTASGLVMYDYASNVN